MHEKEVTQEGVNGCRQYININGEKKGKTGGGAKKVLAKKGDGRGGLQGTGGKKKRTEHRSGGKESDADKYPKRLRKLKKSHVRKKRIKGGVHETAGSNQKGAKRTKNAKGLNGEKGRVSGRKKQSIEGGERPVYSKGESGTNRVDFFFMAKKTEGKKKTGTLRIKRKDEVISDKVCKRIWNIPQALNGISETQPKKREKRKEKKREKDKTGSLLVGGEKQLQTMGNSSSISSNGQKERKAFGGGPPEQTTKLAFKQ